MPQQAVGPGPNYTVDKIGTPDPPDTQYWVLDLVHNHFDREALAYIGNHLRRSGRFQLAQQCWDALDETNAACQEHYERLNARRGKEKRKYKPRGS